MASQRHVTVGGVRIGGGAPVVVQTMTKTETANLTATMDQIRRVAEAGADVVRVAVPRDRDVDALRTIVAESPIPVIADIHFNHTLALKAIDAGAHCIRINPGNIGGFEKTGEVVEKARAANVPMRIGVNSGSLFISLKTDGRIRGAARDLAFKVGIAAAAVAVAFLSWTQVMTGSPASAVAFVVAALALVAALVAIRMGREGWAFLGTFVTIALGVAGLFLALFPDVMPTSLADGVGLTTTNAAATAYTLKIMTVVALVFTPIVLAYQGWTYWVFRKRIAVHHIPTEQLAAGS